MHLVTLASEVRAAPRQNMKPVLGVALQYLLLFLPSAAVPRKRGIGGGLWQAEELEITFPKELGEKEDESTYEGAEPSFMALTSKATAVPHPLLKSDQPGDYAKGAKCPQLFPEEAVSPVVGLESSLPAWLPDRLEGPVCTVRMSRRYGLDQSLLEVVGVLTSYESDFLKLVRHASWDQGQLQTFGICPAGETHSALLSLKHIHAHLAEPGESRFLVLHLEEVTWDAETKLRFTLALQEEVGRSFGEVQSALLVFYLGSRESKARETLLAAGDGLLQKQALCLSRATRYLLLRALVTPATRTPRQLSFHVSLAIRRHGDGGPLLPTSEVQRLLFGADEKCFTRMTPALLLLAKPRCEGNTGPPSSFLPARGVLETAPFPQPSSPPASNAEEPAPNATASQAAASSPAPDSRDQFLSSLTQFVSKVLSPSGEPAAASAPHHWLDFKAMETLPHQLVNLSERAALERLVQSDKPLVLLFPQNSQALLEQQFGHWRLEGSLLQRLLEKLQAVIQELREIPAFQAQLELFQHLLALCYYPPGAGGSDPAQPPPSPRQLRTLLLLKALQTVRAHWQEKRKVSRQNRSAGPQAYCRLQELMIDLHYDKFVILPDKYMANNCEGPCRRPLSTRIPDYSSHSVLLVDMQERGAPLQRRPCCVPVKYSDKEIICMTAEGVQVTTFPNMVAEECGCR